jgi:hypothetical protein
MFDRFALRHFGLLRVVTIWFGIVGLLFAIAAPCRAERPSAMKLFPEDTLLFVRVRNAAEFGERLRESSTGRMIRDPQVAPLVEDLYGKASELYAEQAEAFMGITWEDLQKLPQGEVAFGIVGRPGAKPAFMLLVDQGEGTAASKLLERGLEIVADKGGEFSSEKIGGVDVTVIRDPEHAERMFGVFERESTIVVATDPNVLRNVLWHWDDATGGAGAAGNVASVTGDSADESGESLSDETASASDEAEDEFIPDRTLAENGKFSTLLRNCRRPQDPPPQMLLFVDPIGLFRGFTAGAPGGNFALGFLPMLGLDGVAGLGGTITFSVGPYDDLAHYHLLLDNPRSGVLDLLTFESGDTTPQPFVPYAVENYHTGRWNAGLFYDRLQGLVDKLLGTGTFQKQYVEKAEQGLDINIRDEVVDNIAGRLTWVTAYEKPAHFRSQKHTLIVELVDETKARETLDRIIKKYPDLFEERHFGNVTYHAITPEWWKRMEEEQRPFNPFVAIMDGHLFLGGSGQLFEEMIAARDGTITRLVDSDDYARIVATLGRETAGQTPILFTMQRAEESIRHLYELLLSEKTQQYIDEHAEENPVLAKLSQALKDHQLPPFDTLMQYYGPGGGIIYDTDTGYHGIGFTLRNESP